MNKTVKNIAAAVAFTAVMIAGGADARAFDLKDVLGNTNIGDVVGNVVEGVFTKSDLTMADIYGEWTSDGSAVCFKGDDLLKKAGGIAAAATIESKINPYYEKLGLNNAVLTIQSDGTFTLKAKMMTLSGTVTSAGEGVFNFNFKAFGKMSIGTVPAYVQKSINHLDVMFDASKLKNLISAVAKVTNISIAKTIASMLDSYEGLCIGFSMNKTGTVEGEQTSGASKLGSVLGDILGGSKPASSDTTGTKPATTTDKSTNSTNSNSSASELGSKLFELLNGK